MCVQNHQPCFPQKKRTLSKQIPGLAQVDISPRWSALYVVDWSLNSWSPAEGVSEFQPPEVGKWCFCWKFSFQLLRVCQGLLADFAQTFPLWNLIKVQVPWEKASLLNGWWNTSHSSYVHNVILVETWFLQPSWVDFIPLRVRKFGNWKCLGRSYIHGRKWQVYQVLIMFWLIQSINLHTNLPKQKTNTTPKESPNIKIVLPMTLYGLAQPKTCRNLKSYVRLQPQKQL